MAEAIEFVHATGPVAGLSPLPRSGFVFRVRGQLVTVWVSPMVGFAFEQEGLSITEDWKMSAARAFVEIELGNGWQPENEGEIEFTDRALPFVRSKLGPS